MCVLLKMYFDPKESTCALKHNTLRKWSSIHFSHNIETLSSVMLTVHFGWTHKPNFVSVLLICSFNICFCLFSPKMAILYTCVCNFKCIYWTSFLTVLNIFHRNLPLFKYILSNDIHFKCIWIYFFLKKKAASWILRKCEIGRIITF